MNIPAGTPATTVDPDLLEDFNRRQKVAIQLNRWRPKREEAADLKLRREEAAGES